MQLNECIGCSHVFSQLTTLDFAASVPQNYFQQLKLVTFVFVLDNSTVYIVCFLSNCDYPMPQ